jgi:hypothetical protein
LVKGGLLTAAVLGGVVAAPRVVATTHRTLQASAPPRHAADAAQNPEARVGGSSPSTQVHSTNASSTVLADTARRTPLTKPSEPSERYARRGSTASRARPSQAKKAARLRGPVKPASQLASAAAASVPRAPASNASPSSTGASRQISAGLPSGPRPRRHLARHQSTPKSFRTLKSAGSAVEASVGQRARARRLTGTYQVGTIHRATPARAGSRNASGRHVGRASRSLQASSGAAAVGSQHSVRGHHPTSGRGAAIQVAPTSSAGTPATVGVGATAVPGGTSPASAAFVPPGQLKKGTRP